MKINDVTQVREMFPVFRHRTFLDSAWAGPGFVKAAEASADWHRSSMLLSGPSFDQTLAWLRPVANARKEAAKLLNAEEEEIAFITGTAMGSNAIVNALPLGPGDNIVINDLEFSANAIPFTAQQRRGVEIRRVTHKDGAVSLDDYEKLIDKNTRLVAISSVQWTSGFRIDLERLVQMANVHGAYVLVDSCQSLGALELDVKKTGIHFMTTQAHKWLFGGWGVGLLYCRRDLVELLDPVYVESGNLVKIPARMPYHYLTDLDNIGDFSAGFAPTAARLQHCTNLPGLWGFNESLKYINSFGIANIEERVLYLVGYLLEQLRKVDGVTVRSGFDAATRSGLAVVTTGSSESDVKKMQELSGLGIATSVRYQANFGGIRISCHFYNNEEDIDRLVAALMGKVAPLYFH